MLTSVGIRGLVFAAACLASAATLAAAADYNLPDLGQPADSAMTPAQEKKLGAQVVYQLRTQNAIVDDPELEAYLNQVGKRLARHTPRRPSDFHFYVIDNDAINAFALPGGYIGVNSGLIIATDSESELASVMAHEIAHVTQRHIARQMEESRGDSIATMATALVAAIAGAAAGAGGDAVPAAIMGGMSHLGMQQLSYTRAHEYEADRVGIGTLAASGYDPTAMARFFETMQRESDLYGRQLPQILLSHPVSTTRMAEAQARAARFSHVKVHTNPDYPFMKERARVLQAASVSDLQQYYQHELAGSNPTPADHYGYALVLTRLGRDAQAIKILKPQARAHPDELPWTMALADAQSHAGHMDDARRLLAAAVKRFPDRDAPKLAYAQTLEASHRPAAMRNFLLSQGDILHNYPQAQALLAQGAGDQGHLGEAYFRQARYYAMQNDYPRAINQLRTALQTAQLSHYDQSRLKALRTQMVSDCYAAWSADECRRGVMEDSRY